MVPLTGLVLSISNDTIIGTGSISASGAAVYLGDFSTGGISVQTVSIEECVITKSNHNRGVDEEVMLPQASMGPVLLPIMGMPRGVLEAMKGLPFLPNEVHMLPQTITLLPILRVAPTMCMH